MTANCLVSNDPKCATESTLVEGAFHDILVMVDNLYYVVQHVYYIITLVEKVKESCN